MEVGQEWCHCLTSAPVLLDHCCTTAPPPRGRLHPPELSPQGHPQPPHPLPEDVASHQKLQQLLATQEQNTGLLCKLTAHQDTIVVVVGERSVSLKELMALWEQAASLQNELMAQEMAHQRLAAEAAPQHLRRMVRSHCHSHLGVERGLAGQPLH